MPKRARQPTWGNPDAIAEVVSCHDIHWTHGPRPFTVSNRNAIMPGVEKKPTLPDSNSAGHMASCDNFKLRDPT